MAMVSSTLGSPTNTFWKRRSSAASFSPFNEAGRTGKKGLSLKKTGSRGAAPLFSPFTEETREKKHHSVTLEEFKKSLYKIASSELNEIQRLTPLFKDEEELRAFKLRHEKDKAPAKELSKAEGAVFLGIDAGSTTTKAVLIDRDGTILWKFYDVNAGNPVELAVKLLKILYKALPEKAYIARSVSTGYGEHLFQTASLRRRQTLAHLLEQAHRSRHGDVERFGVSGHRDFNRPVRNPAHFGTDARPFVAEQPAAGSAQIQTVQAACAFVECGGQRLHWPPGSGRTR